MQKINLDDYKTFVFIDNQVHYEKFLISLVNIRDFSVLSSLAVKADKNGAMKAAEELCKQTHNIFKNPSASINLDKLSQEIYSLFYTYYFPDDYLVRTQSSITVQNIIELLNDKTIENIEPNNVKILINHISGEDEFIQARKEIQEHNSTVFEKFQADVQKVFNVDPKMFTYLTSSFSRKNKKDFMKKALAEIERYYSVLNSTD